jgi:acyl-CoA dehydrogenase-like protein
MVNCLDLNEDQLQIEKWVHDFVEKVIRPAAREWDEREETPWQGNRRMGERAGHSDARRGGPRPRASRGAVVPRRDDLHHIRGHVGNTAPAHGTRDLGRTHQAVTCEPRLPSARSSRSHARAARARRASSWATPSRGPEVPCWRSRWAAADWPGEEHHMGRNTPRLGSRHTRTRRIAVTAKRTRCSVGEDNPCP